MQSDNATNVALSCKVVSNDGPKEDEKAHEALLAEWVMTTMEPEEESNRRQSVMGRLNQLIRTWITQTMINEFRMQESAAKLITGRIFATGSYRYNVHTSGSDIDIVLIAPARITRDHFFDSLAVRLKQEPWVSDLHCIRDTRVPIIAMVCDGIDIDLSFGSIRQDRVPEQITDNLLEGLDEQSVLSCNAVRVAHEIINAVPAKGVFRHTLRFVKAWGKRRGIYSNTFGFPSGIGWAILVAFVSQCYPNQNAAGLVTRFFRTYNTWFKPNPRELGVENRAIYLTPSMRAKTSLGKCWDPREKRSDAKALFPVLTPALPYGNACYNVTATNLKQLCEEFKRGHELTAQYLSLSPEEAQVRFGRYGLWSKLLEPAEFFGKFQHYMHIQISCSDPELYQAYVDGVESKIRTLWSGHPSSQRPTLEDIPQLKLRLNPKRFEDPEEVEQRSQLLKKLAAVSSAANATSSLPASGRTSTRESGTLSHRTSVMLSSSASPQQPPVTFVSTAHYFIGMEVDTRISDASIDLSPSIATFYEVILKLRQFKKGTTNLPDIKVRDITGIPAFALEAAGYKPPQEQDVAAIPTAANQEKAEAGGGTASPRPPPQALTKPDGGANGVGEKRGRSEEAGSDAGAPPPYGGESGHSRTAPPAAANKTSDLNLEEVLGLDF